MLRTCFIPALWTMLAAADALAQAPERVVSGHTLRSDRDPAVLLELKGPVQYVGADRWVLYGVADAEVHVFVEANSSKKVTRLYWIQFEGYLPSVNSTATHRPPARSWATWSSSSTDSSW